MAEFKVTVDMQNLEPMKELTMLFKEMLKDKRIQMDVREEYHNKAIDIFDEYFEGKE